MYGWIYTGLGALLLTVVAFVIALRKKVLAFVKTASGKLSKLAKRLFGRS